MLVLIKGAGDVASGVALRIWRSGFDVIMTEIPEPTVIRRTVAFAEAVYQGIVEVEGVTARLAKDASEAMALLKEGVIPVLVDPEANCRLELAPQVIVDATLAKRNLGTFRGQAPLVIGCGPGFTAGEEVDLVVETKRGHYLGRVLTEGSAAPNTGIPGSVEGYAEERVLRATADGLFTGLKEIGDYVNKGQAVAKAGEEPICAEISGVLRGILRSGLQVHKGMKVGDIDPRGEIQYCYTVSDKALAVGGGVLEGILRHQAMR
ncbi:MAG: EF2563 family selenium-dependent molybdenum hydroxylase system protein [Clostridia bacterium]|jgi:xanthine dehydrogenase accessory factor|nr:EF2563 family selenium-dependent molybdenum hydroxylase system protein [Clostridia bacterium]